MRTYVVACGVAIVLQLPGSNVTHAQTARALSRTVAPRLLTTSEVATKATPATVTILTFDEAGDTLSQGSGFIVRSDGVVVTNWHVIKGAHHAVVILADHEQYERVALVEADSNVDVALLRIPGDSLPVLETRSAIPEVGSHVVAIGSPLGFSRTVSEGIVAATRVIAGRQLVQISAPISAGSSGGAVLDGTGRVFAITTSTIEGGQALNFAVPVRYAVGLLATATGTKPFPAATPEQSRSSSTAMLDDPARTDKPSPVILGAYKAIETIRDANGAPRALLLGYLVAGEHVGWLSQWWQNPDSTRDPMRVYNVAAFRTNAAGSVALSVGGQTYDGYQTDKGFALKSALTIADTSRTLDLRGYRYEIPLSQTLGIYTVRCHTTYFYGKKAQGAVEWTGELAAAVDDSSNVYVDLWMENSDGGSTAATGRAHLEPDGSFQLVVARNGHWAHLTGTVRAGTLAAQWDDEREHGHFEGTLEADRQ
jgi:S1-C subfamily serine protease